MYGGFFLFYQPPRRYSRKSGVAYDSFEEKAGLKQETPEAFFAGVEFLLTFTPMNNKV